MAAEIENRRREMPNVNGEGGSRDRNYIVPLKALQGQEEGNSYESAYIDNELEVKGITSLNSNVSRDWEGKEFINSFIPVLQEKVTSTQTFVSTYERTESKNTSSPSVSGITSDASVEVESSTVQEIQLEKGFEPTEEPE